MRHTQKLSNQQIEYYYNLASKKLIDKNGIGYYHYTHHSYDDLMNDNFINDRVMDTVTKYLIYSYLCKIKTKN